MLSGFSPQIGRAGAASSVSRSDSRSGSVSYHTYMKFKGCEASVVILLDVDEADPRWNRTGLYTAMSRAMHRLVILKSGS